MKLLVLLVLVVAVAAAPVSRTGRWTKSTESVDPLLSMPVTFALRYDDATYRLLDETCASVSDPTKPTYAQYLNRDEVTALVSSGVSKHVNTVTEWLQLQGIPFTVAGNGDFVRTQLTASEVTDVFGVELEAFSHQDDAQARIVRSLRHPRMPADVDAAVDVVLGVSDFPPLKPRTSRAQDVPLDLDPPLPAAGGPLPPIVSLTAIGETSVDLYFIQLCGPKVMANTSIPCTGQEYPVDAYQVQVKDLNGFSLNITMNTPSDLTMHHSATETGVAIVLYQLSLPVPVPAFSKLLVSMRAVSGNMTSTFAGMQFNSTTVPADDQYILATPFVTPEYLRSLYGLPSHQAPAVGATVTQSVAEFGGQFYSPTDMELFAKEYDPSIKPASAVIVKGENMPTHPGGEAMLDIEWILAMAPQMTSVFWSVEPNPNKPPANGTYDFILEWALQVNNATDPPLVTSISYGLPEREIPAQLDPDYIRRANVEFAKMCVRGLTVTVSSGDAGATGSGHSTAACELTAQYPTGSPYVTSVSATLISTAAPPRKGPNCTDALNCVGEVSVSIPNGLFWTTGGGFSNDTAQAQPAWQKTMVQSYLSSAAAAGLPMPPAGSFNPALRAYPDVSAVGHNLLTATNGFVMPVDGTSASSPIFAGSVSLLNQYRIDAGKAALGFLNPLLYSIAASNPDIFYDVTIGENSCGAFTCCSGLGYSTATGWDAVTGLGSIQDFDGLKDLVLSLP